MGYNLSGITGYVQQLKEEADRKEQQRQEEERRRQEEEARRQSLIAWQRSNPVGPPTREQLLGPTPQPDVSKPPTTRNVASQLSRPQVDTSTPSLQATSVMPQTQTPTVQQQPYQPPAVQQQREEKPKPYQSPYAQQQVQQPQAQWNPPLGTGVSLVAPQWTQGLLKGYQDIQPYLEQGKQFVQRGLDFGMSNFQAPQTDAWNALMDLEGQRLNQRQKERQAYTPGTALNFGAIGDVSLGQPGITLNNIAQAASAIDWAASKTIGPEVKIGDQKYAISTTSLLGSGIDLLQMLDEFASIIPTPGKLPTAGAYYSAMRDVGQQAVNAPNVLTPETRQALSIFTGGNQQWVDQIAFLDPKAWTNFGNIAEYWDVAQKNILGALTPSPEQQAAYADKPEMIKQAYAYALVMGHHGYKAFGQTFDDYLDYPIQSQGLMQEATQLAQQADQAASDRERTILYGQAGMKAAQAIKLRETTPLDLYNKNQDAFYSLPFEAIFGFSNVGDWLGWFSKGATTPAGRRLAQGQELAGMAENAADAANLTPAAMVKNMMSWMETNRSKATVATYTNFSVLTNILSGLETKGDIAKAFTKYIDGTILNGIPLTELTSPSAALQAVNGVFQFGWAGIKDYRAAAARKEMAPILGWIQSMPSLAGEGNEIANKVEVMGDLLGVLIRQSAQRYGVSAMKDIPFGAKVFNVVPQAAGKAVVEYVDSLGNIVGRSAEMSQVGAVDYAKRLGEGVKAGHEFRTNWVKAVGDWERSILSTYTLNANPGSVIGNAIGGWATGVMDQGFSNEMLHPLSEQIDYLSKKLGGFLPSARLAEGVGNIKPTGASFTSQQVPTGMAGLNKTIGTLLNWSTFGLAEAGKKIRTGASKMGEEGIAANIYYSAFKNFVERELPTRIAPVVEGILQNAGVNSPDTVKWITSQIVDSGLKGGRLDIAKTFQEIANGRIAPSISNISPVFADLFNSEQTLELNGLLRNLTPETLEASRTRINTIINQAIAATEEHIGQLPVAPEYNYFTRLDNNKDVADIVDMMQHAAQMSNRNPDVAREMGQRVKDYQQAISDSMQQVMQMAAQQQIPGEYMFNLWHSILNAKDETWGRIGKIYETIKAIPPPQVQQVTSQVVTQASKLTGGVIDDYFIDQMKSAFKLDDEQAAALQGLLTARAHAWAELTGQPAEKWIGQILQGTYQIDAPGVLGSFNSFGAFKGPGMIEASKDLLEMVTSYGSSFKDRHKWGSGDRMAVLLHEMGHMFMLDMENASQYSEAAMKEWEAAKAWLGDLTSKPVDIGGRTYSISEAKERFANGFARYMQTGEAPSPELGSYFERFRNWLANVLEGLFRGVGAVDKTLPVAQSQTYDRLFTFPQTQQITEQVVTNGEDIGKQWENAFALVQAQWDDFGRNAIKQIEQARDDILSGKALEKLQSGEVALFDGQPMDPNFNIADVLHGSPVDPDVLENFFKMKLGFQSIDPRAKEVIKAFRQQTQWFQNKMFMALTRYPTENGFDAFLGAMGEIKGIRSGVLRKVNAAKEYINSPEFQAMYAAVKDGTATAEMRKTVAQGFDRLRLTNDAEWKKYYKSAWDRYEAATRNIIREGIPQEASEGLNFTWQGQEGWKIRGPAWNYPGQFSVLSPDGRAAIMPVGPGGVPAAAVDAWKGFIQMVETEVAEQMGRIGLGAVARDAGKFPEVDEVLSTIGDAATDSLYQQVRRKIQQATAEYGRQLVIPTDYPAWRQQKLEVARNAFNNVLGDIAQMNAQGYGRLGLDTISQFNKAVLPIFDNIISGAQRYGDEMTSFSVLDYTRQYHPDVLLGLFAPYHFFFTRQGKNALERQLFHPKWGNSIIRYMRNNEAQNRAEDQPNRNIDKMQGGLTVGDTTYNFTTNLLARWIPIFPIMMMHGWADPDRANRGYEYALDSAKEQAFPATAKGWAGNIAQLSELAKTGGLSIFPWYDAAVDLAMGVEPELQGSAGQLSPLWRTLGWGMVPFANWAKDNGYTGVENVANAVAWATVPDYSAYLNAREASFEAARGNLSDPQAQVVQDVFRQQATGEAPLPEQQLLNPQAAAQAQAIESRVGVEYLIRGLIAWALGGSVAAEYGPEKELRAAKETQSNMAYTPTGNPAGSQNARFGMTDPDNPNFQPGLAPFNSQYAAMGEGSPYSDSGEPPKRPALTAAQTEYYKKLDAINKKYTAASEAAYQAHPEWATREGMTEANAFDKQQNEAKQAEIDALKELYPSVAVKDDQRPANNPYVLYGARPSEVVDKAKGKLYGAVNDAVPYPAEGSPPAAYDQFNADQVSKANELMGKPGEVLYGQPPSNRPHGSARKSLPTPTLQNVAPQVSPATQNVVQPTSSGTITPDPNNQWFDLMSQLEQQYNLPPGIMQEVARHESSFDPNADSGAANGLFQFTPSTWASLPPEYSNGDPNDPELATKAAAYYLDWINQNLPSDKRNDPAWMAAAYTAGIGAVSPLSTIDEVHTLGYSDAQAKEDYAKAIGAAVSNPSPAVTNSGIQPTLPFAGDFPLTQEYGVNPERYKSWGGHMGLDYKMPVGTPILATQQGTVVDTGSSPAGQTPSRPGTGGFGNWIIVEYPDGYTVEYGHLSQIDVKPGDSVGAGQTIGLSGHTGVSDFPHLHFGVRQNGEYVNPHQYLDYLAQQPTTAPVNTGTSTATAPVTPPATSAASSVPGTPTDFPWGASAQEIINQQKTKNQAPSRVAAEAAVNAEFEAIKQRAIKTYPAYANLWQEYRTLTDDQKQEWTQAHPMMRALNMAGYNPDEWAYVEKTFGKGSVERWANIPRGDDIQAEASAYYHQYPDVFLAKAWIDGRPQPYRDEGFDPEVKFERNFGKDYETAQEMFGGGIWDTVREYYTIPPYVDGGDNSKWIAFKKAHPEYDQWRAWWYELMGATAKPAFSGFGYRDFSSHHGNSKFRYEYKHDRNYIMQPEFQHQRTPQFSEGSAGNSDWRKYLALGEVNLKGWRR